MRLMKREENFFKFKTFALDDQGDRVQLNRYRRHLIIEITVLMNLNPTVVCFWQFTNLFAIHSVPQSYVCI